MFQVSPSAANVKWFVEEMPVIEEEDEKSNRKTPRNLSSSRFKEVLNLGLMNV